MIDEQVTLDDVISLNEYYAKNPPSHQLIAAYVGYKHEEPEQISIEDFMKGNI